MNYTRTENDALTYASSNSCCLDLFSGIGASRNITTNKIIERFQRAYAENPDLAMKCLFFARDIRNGLGERNVFKQIMAWLAWHHPESVVNNLHFVAEFGRYDDLLALLDTPCKKAVLEIISKQVAADKIALIAGKPEEVSLLGKWLPSINASNKYTICYAKKIAAYLKLDNKAYRKLLTELRAAIKIIENNLRLKDYSFDYGKQPSKAMLKYRKAFWRNDDERYKAFLEKVHKSEASMHTGTLAPYDIIKSIVQNRYNKFDDQERASLNTTWNAQEDFTNGENALVVVDGSGSMYGWGNPCAAAVAQSLGIYFAERNTGHFKNHFITFSENPRLIEIKGKDIVDKVQYCMGYNECANTNISKVFELILNTAQKYKLSQAELPSRLYIISDMEFDKCAEDADIANFEYAKKIFARAGYTLPQIVFWNVDARNEQVPVTKNEQGVALVSGCSPQIFALLQNGDFNPMSFMLKVLNSERYCNIKAYIA